MAKDLRQRSRLTSSRDFSDDFTAAFNHQSIKRNKYEEENANRF